MGRPREPVELILAKGAKHLTSREIEERSASEVKAPVPEKIRVPAWVPKDLRKDFRGIARQLIELKIYSELDGDTLGRYLVAHQNYVAASEPLTSALEELDAKAAENWASIQDKFFKQAQAAARELGLTVSARCRLVLPAAQGGEEPENPFLRLLKEA